MEKPLQNNENECLREHHLGVLRGAARSYFSSVNLSSAQNKRLEALLLSAPPSSTWSEKQRFLSVFLKKNKLVLLSNLATALAVAGIFIFYSHFLSVSEISQDVQDIISEVAVQPDASMMPADFNLEGNFESLQELIDDSLPQTQMFMPNIPAQIAQSYAAYEGRFFLVKGQQGVSISIKPSVGSSFASNLNQIAEQKLNSTHPSTLYIVKLNKKSQADFPQQKTLRKVFSATGKINRVYAWREGTYGYAMVQPPTTPE